MYDFYSAIIKLRRYHPALRLNVTDPYRQNYFNKENWLPEWVKYIQQNIKRILPAVGSRWIPRTNNMAERFFREFSRFYARKGGLSYVESYRKHCNLFFLWYNFKTYSRDDARKEIRGLSPLELHAPDIVRLPCQASTSLAIEKSFLMTVA